MCETNAARRETVPIPLPAGADEPKTDADHIAAIRRYLRQQGLAGRLSDSATYNEACGMASAIHDGETYRAMIKEIRDAALPSGAPARPPAPDSLAPDRQALLIARTHLDIAAASALPAQIRQQISDARKQLYQVGDDLVHDRQALEAEATRILAELDGRAVPPAPVQQPSLPARPARPKSANASEVLDYLHRLEDYATALEQLLKSVEPDPIRAIVDDRATFEMLLADLEQMVEGGDLSPEQIASGVRALEQLDDRYNELSSSLSHQDAQAYSDRMDRLQAAFEGAEQQEATA